MIVMMMMMMKHLLEGRSVKSGVVMLEEVVCQSNRIASKAGYRF
jgi:hypothetical protein